MSETGGTAAVFSAEGGGVFENMLGRYANTPNLEVYLKGYDGEQIKVTRGNRDREPQPIERAHLTICVVTQPDTLRTLVEKPQLRDRGLIQRMSFSVPAHSLVGYRASLCTPISTVEAEAYRSIVLASLRVERPQAPHTLRLDAEALAEYQALDTSIECRLRPDGDLHELGGWAGKLRGKIVRIAALIHLTEHAHDPEPWKVPLSADAFRRAAKLTEYLIANARRAFGLMSRTPEAVAAKRVLDWLHRERRPFFTTSDVHRFVMKNARSVDDVRAILRHLEMKRYVAKVTAKRRDQERWTVHPDLLRTWKHGAPKPAA